AGRVDRRRCPAAPFLIHRRSFIPSKGGQTFVVAVVPISSEAFAPFGDVFEASTSTDRDAVSAQWAVVARERYGSEVAPRALALPARAPELSFIEAHPNSPQLSVAFDSPWIL